MVRDELERAIECPAQRAGLRVEPALVKHLVDDVEHEPGALPLLSSALLELWQYRDGRRLSWPRYEHTGGVKGAVARLANEAYGRLDDPQQALARRVLPAARRRRRGGRRRAAPVPLEEFGDGEDAGRVLGLLADRRLLTISDGTVELAHEALLREWPFCAAGSRTTSRASGSTAACRTSAREWRDVGRDDGALYRGARLAEARAWAARDDASLTDAEREFLARASTATAASEPRTGAGLALAFAALTVGW